MLGVTPIPARIVRFGGVPTSLEGCGHFLGTLHRKLSEAKLAADAPQALLAHRLVIVTGKGGTGKTTVSAALALAAAHAGLRVLVVEVGPDEQIPGLLEPGCPPVGYEGRTLPAGPRALRIDPFEALTEYLSLQFGARSLVELVVKNSGFRQLMNAAPGWRELITLGKIWHLAQLRAESGSPSKHGRGSPPKHGRGSPPKHGRGSPPGRDDPDLSSDRRFDLIVVDAPASGHGIAFLEVPRVVVSAVRTGPLHKHAEHVEEMLEDPEQTLVLPVTLAEELPAREVAELVKRVQGEMGLSMDRIIVNAAVQPPFPGPVQDLDQVLERIDGDLDLGKLSNPRTLAWCARYLESRYELNHSYMAEIRNATGLPIVWLPRISEGIHGISQIDTLAQALLAQPGDPK
jgi:anion-transporting  ArsA/GET3 family ATPase